MNKSADLLKYTYILTVNLSRTFIGKFDNTSRISGFRDFRPFLLLLLKRKSMIRRTKRKKIGLLKTNFIRVDSF